MFCSWFVGLMKQRVDKMKFHLKLNRQRVLVDQIFWEKCFAVPRQVLQQVVIPWIKGARAKFWRNLEDDVFKRGWFQAFGVSWSLNDTVWNRNEILYFIHIWVWKKEMEFFISAGREKCLLNDTFLWKVEDWCDHTKRYWWLLSICGDLLWLVDASGIPWTTPSTWPFCQILLFL